MTRDDDLYIVVPVAQTVEESLRQFGNLICLQRPLSLTVEHPGDDGELRLVELTLLRAEDDQATFGKMQGVSREGGMAPERFGWTLGVDLCLPANTNNSVPAKVEFHWVETTSEGARPVYGLVNLVQQHRPRLGIPHDGPLPER